MAQYSLHTLALVLSMASPMRCNLRSEGDHAAISEGTEAGLFEPVPLHNFPSHIVVVPGTKGQEIGIQLTAKGRELAHQIKLKVDQLLEPFDRIGAMA